MEKTIHLKGFGKDLDICSLLSDNYNVPHDTFYMNDNESKPVSIENCLIQIWHTNKECSLEKAMEGHLRILLGDFYLEGSEYGYSEYTIMGFEVSEAKIGGHNIQAIINNYKNEYLHILITEIDQE